MKREYRTTIKKIVESKGRKAKQYAYPLTLAETMMELKAEDYDGALSDVPIEEQDRLIQEWEEFAARPRRVFDVSKGADERKPPPVIPAEDTPVVKPPSKSSPQWHVR